MYQVVMTADVVSSRNIAAATLEQRMKEIAKMIEIRFLKRKKTFEFFRGDSFQAIIPNAEIALCLAIIWRSAIKATANTDLRIAIGVGEIDYEAKSVAQSAGQAFEFSGLLLDDLKKNDRARIGIQTPSKQWNDELLTNCILAEPTIRRWTQAGAETVFYQFLHDETQGQLASRLGISQSSVNKRLQAANWQAIRHWEQHFRKQTLSYLQN